MLKVLFINITLEQTFGLSPLSWYYRQGVGSISAVLRKYSHETALLVLTRFDEGRVSDVIEDFRPDLVAVSSTSGTIGVAGKVIGFVHDRYGVPIVLGGVHATVVPEEAVKIRGLFAVCVGEGEFPLLELCEQLDSGRLNFRVRNMWFVRRGRIVKNPIRDLMHDLDGLPFGDRSIFDYSEKVRKTGHVEVSAGRGCPYHCTICINHSLQEIYHNKGKFVRLRSVKNVLTEIEQLVCHYPGIKVINFYDETFTLNKRWLKKFCEAYRERIGISFMCSTRIDTLDKGIIRLMRHAGCTKIRVGIESGDDYIRQKIVKKRIRKSR